MALDYGESAMSSGGGGPNSNRSKCWRPDGEEAGELYVHMTTPLYHFLALTTTIGLLVSLVSNLIIIYLFIRTPYLRSNPSSIIAVNLSVSDLLYCTQWPLVIYSSLTQSARLLENQLICQALGFITVSTALASILTVLALSIERAVVIMYSMRRRHRPTIKLAWLLIVLIWLLALLTCAPPLFGKLNRYTLDPSKTSCTLDYLSSEPQHKLYILALYLAYWLLPAILITISYALIFATFKRSSLRLEEVELGVPTAAAQGRSTQPDEGGGIAKVAEEEETQPSNLRGGGGGARRFCGRYAGARRASADLVDSINRTDRRAAKFGGSIINNKARGGGGCGGHGRRIHTESLRERSGASGVIGLTASAAPSSQRRPFLGGRRRLSRQTSGISRASSSIRRTAVDSAAASDHDCRSLSSMLQKGLRLARPRDSVSLAAAASSQRRRRALLQFRLAKMSFYLILLWLVSWTPIASLAMLNSVLHCHRTSASAVFVAITMTKLGPALDVFIYGISHPRLKSQFKRIIKRPLLLFA